MRLVVFPPGDADPALADLAEAVKRFITHCRDNSYDDPVEDARDGPADLVLFLHAIDGVALSPVRVARYDLPGRATILLLPIRPQLLANAPQAGIKGCLALLPRRGIAAQLRQILDAPDADGTAADDLQRIRVSGGDLEELLAMALGNGLKMDDDTLWAAVAKIKGLRDQSRERLRAQVLTLLKAPTSDSLACWQYALDLLTLHYEEETHAWQSEFDAPFKVGTDDAHLAQEWRARRFLEACHDLGSALLSEPFSEPVGKRSKQDTILLIDDKPEGDFFKLVDRICVSLLPGWKPSACNPNAPDYKPIFIFLKQYGTMTGVLEHKYETKLQEMLERVRFVLIDQLLTDPPSGFSRFEGPQLIRGLIRYLRDHPGPERHRVPEIIALSRTDEPDRIQEALRAGARDYLVKRRGLELPAVLSRVALGTSEPRGVHHQNFRTLYRLPNETIGLLQELRIPRTTFHRQVEPRQLDQRWVELLRVLPKTDLHVHIGSCMSPEFLTVASLVGLLRRGSSALGSYLAAASLLRLAAGSEGLWDLSLAEPLVAFESDPGLTGLPAGPLWMRGCACRMRAHLRRLLAELRAGDTRYTRLRALLHAELALPDYLDGSELAIRLQERSNLDLSFFALRHSRNLSSIQPPLANEDLLRIYLLVLAAHQRATSPAQLMTREIDLLDCFRQGATVSLFKRAWDRLHDELYGKGDLFSVSSFRSRGWRWPPDKLDLFRLDLKRSLPDLARDTWPQFGDAPIEWSLASGLRSASLIQYLEGCELSGAEHLRHPFLIHLYAQQALADFMREGAFYVELRGSPDGYAQAAEGFEFPEACGCLVAAFTDAQQNVLSLFQRHRKRRRQGKQRTQETWAADMLGKRYALHSVEELLARRPSSDSLGRYLPCKVSLIFVGKRHKSTREMILEVAAAAVMRPSVERAPRSAKDLVERELGRCRVVGFDLAGKEVGNPPHLFVADFSRLSRLHIPLTVHAGENASARFIEEAVLELKARRIGHGLSLAEDRGLLARAREEKVCVELCPVSNHQTSHFSEPGDLGRNYPLRLFLDEGLLVSLNTDNPMISNTNLVKEYFQASHAYDQRGMPLWQALRVLRMGYIASFLSLPERHALLDLVDEFLFDLFSDHEVVQRLRELLQSPQRQDSAELPASAENGATGNLPASAPGSGEPRSPAAALGPRD